MAIERAKALLLMRKAFKAGVSFNKFYRDRAVIDLKLRRSVMMADWRDVNNIMKVEGLARFVRRGYVPSQNIAQLKARKLDKEYHYVVRVESRLRPDVDFTTRFIQIGADTPQTVEAIEQEAYERTFGQSPPKPEEERKFTTWSVLHRVSE